MANPIKASDLYQDDGALTRLEAQLKAIATAMEELNAKAGKYAAQVKRQSAATKDGQKEIERSARQASKLEKEQEKLTEAYSETNKEIQRLRAERTKANRIARNEIKLAESAEGSYNALSAQYSLMKEELNAMSEQQRKFTKEGQAMEKQAKAIYEEMKALQAATGKTSLNVGNYAEAIREAGSGTFGLEKAMQLLSKTPLLGILGLLVAAVTTLFQAFIRSERGAELMAKATGALEGVMSLLVGVANKVADTLVSLWEDPVQGVKDLWAAIKDNIVSRFEGLINLFKVAGDGLEALWNRDLPGLKKAAKEAAQSVVQLTTGMDPERQNEYADSVQKTVNAFAALAAARREIVRQNRELTRQAEAVATQEQLAQVLADDATRSFAEREAQAEKARAALERRAGLEVQIARNNLSLIEREIALRRAQGEDVEGLLDQQLAAFQALQAAEREYTVTVADNEKTRRELKQDRLERDLDILIDAFDNQKTINERIIADEERALASRRALLAETSALAERSFAKQIETIQQFTGVAVNANELLAESDAVVLNERIRQLGLSEIIEGRLLEIIRERRLAVQDLAEAQRDLTRATEAEAQALDTLPLFQGAEQQAGKVGQSIARELLGGVKVATQGTESESIYDALGLSVGPEGQKQLEGAFDAAKQQFADFQAQRAQFTQAQVQASKAEVQAAQQRLNAEVQAAQAGYASRVDTARAELELAEQAQAEAEKRQEKARRAQLLGQSVAQASNLITAVSKIFAELPFFLALPASATLFASFAAAKVKAFQATKIFRKGGYENLDYGGSHESGNDISLGFDSNGVERRAERGEGLAVFSRQATTKYGSAIPAIVAAINAGEFERKYQRLAGEGRRLPIISNAVNVNTGGMERELKHIRRNGERQITTDAQGRRIEKYKNRVRIYV